MGASNAWLMQPDFYASSCPNVEQIVYNTMKQAVSKEPRMGASILRLFFHDCFVNGCDASVLLDDTPTFTGEKTAKANANNSIRGFEVIDAIKCNLEAACPQTVSCADILALASRDGVRLLGGPTWKVPLGRRDARTASLSLANQNLPPPRSSLANLTSLFARQNLNINEMTALSGGHTIGLARCINFRPHIYNDTDIDPTFAATRQANCPKQAGNGDFNLAPLDRQTPNKFDNDYFQNLVQKRGLLHSDQELLQWWFSRFLGEENSSSESTCGSGNKRSVASIPGLFPPPSPTAFRSADNNEVLSMDLGPNRAIKGQFAIVNHEARRALCVRHATPSNSGWQYMRGWQNKDTCVNGWSQQHSSNDGGALQRFLGTSVINRDPYRQVVSGSYPLYVLGCDTEMGHQALTWDLNSRIISSEFMPNTNPSPDPFMRFSSYAVSRPNSNLQHSPSYHVTSPVGQI
uniref:peroxidase n=1 Tax=Chenopodium quinoa TaxID=63459 RepID=A0A803NDW0_CHEQI